LTLFFLEVDTKEQQVPELIFAMLQVELGAQPPSLFLVMLLQLLPQEILSFLLEDGTATLTGKQKVSPEVHLIKWISTTYQTAVGALQLSVKRVVGLLPLRLEISFSLAVELLKHHCLM